MENVRCKMGIIFLAVVLLKIQCFAQNSLVNWSSFSSGFGLSNSGNSFATSSVGQSFVGISSNSNSQITSGFLSMKIDDIIPVELASFTSIVNENNVTLKWQTAAEINNSGFEVERQNLSPIAQGGIWGAVGFVEGRGTSSKIQNYTYTDKNLMVGIYNYRIKQIDFDGSYKYSDLIEDVEISAPEIFDLSQNYPNPFNPTTKINFSLAANSKVVLEIFNALGQEVAALLNRDIEAGYHTINFDATDLSSGIYFYSLKAKGIDGTDFIATKKMLMVK
jgi:hypothetical protein